MTRRVLVLGGTGSVGREVVAALVDRGTAVRVLTRDPESARRRVPEAAELVSGDVADPASLSRALNGATAVILNHGAPYGGGDYRGVDYGAIPNLLEALAGRSMPIALMSAIGVTGPLRHFGDVLDWKLRAERLLRVSGLPYTIVRPGWFDHHGPDQRRALLQQGDTTGEGPVRRTDIAEALIRALELPEAQGRTVELFAQEGEPLEHWADAFAAMDPDVSSRLDAVHDRETLPLDDEPAEIRADLERFAAPGRSPLG